MANGLYYEEVVDSKAKIAAAYHSAVSLLCDAALVYG
ncbi:hypothetical protein OROMI_028465 [Orobanche minor]